MRISKILWQHRRDFTAKYKCEHCGYTMKDSGYDDNNFHNNVIPRMACPSCGKTASDDYRPLTPKYSEETVI